MEERDMKNQVSEWLRDGVEIIRLGAFDVDGILRGKYVSLKKLSSSLESGLGFCDVIFGWDSSDKLYDNVKFTGWHTGYPDAHAKIETSTLRRVPWEDDIPFFLMDFYEADGAPLTVSPRQVLRGCIDQANAAGFRPRFAAEFEFFLFNESPHSIREKDYKNLRSLTPGMFGYSALRASSQSPFVHDLLANLSAFEIEIEGFHTETGPGVYEAAIGYGEVLEAADKAALFKTAVKEICYQHDIMATFMAKFNGDLPGSSGHTHQSLWTMDGEKNVFAGTDATMSDTFRWYIGGLCKYLPELTAMFCPTINSYKRLIPGMWAPTKVTWGYENRTVGLRIIPGTEDKHVRVENRIVGADANPYLAFAANLAAGLEGIANQIEPPREVTGNGYEAEDAGESIASNLGEAAALFRKSDIAKRWFGERWVDHYASTREWEWREYQKAVTDWELRRYFEII